MNLGIVIQKELLKIKDDIELNKFLIHCFLQIDNKEIKVITTIDNGFDKFIYEFCTEKLIPYKCFYVDWKEYGKTALYIRSDIFVNCCNNMFILKEKNSIETDYIIENCKKTNKQYEVIDVSSFKKL